jgi:hypothetical protein
MSYKKESSTGIKGLSKTFSRSSGIFKAKIPCYSAYRNLGDKKQTKKFFPGKYGSELTAKEEAIKWINEFKTIGE